jgi:hypothetical protein
MVIKSFARVFIIANSELELAIWGASFADHAF